MAFSELLGRSSFSFLRGASQPEEMVVSAKEMGLNSLAICDRDGLYGSVRAFNEAKNTGLRVHVGATLSLAPVGARVQRVTDPKPQSRVSEEWSSLMLLVRDLRGYENLCRLLSAAHAGLAKGQSLLELDVLEKHHQGLLLVLPAQDPSECNWFSSRGEGISSHRWVGPLKELFRGHGYIAAWRRLDGHDQARHNSVIELAEYTGFPVIASSFPLFHQCERKPLADIVQCIRQGQTLEDAGTQLLSNTEAYLRSEEQMLRLFSDHPEWVARTAEAASQLEFQFDQLNYQFPCELEDGETADARLARLTWEGAGRRYPSGVPPRVVQQLKKELRLIAELDVAPYFLCTWEIVEIARELRVLCQGRGSAANSAVCFVLGITAVDPARSNLLFERFLSAERAEPPDIDIDFEHERREEVIQAIYERHGREHAAMVSEVICYRGKSALREVGKVFGLSLAQIDHLCQSITHWDTAAIGDEKLRQYGFDPRDIRLKQVIHWAQELAGFPRHLSIHVGGFVLSKTPLFEVAPIEPAAMPGRTVIPWDKDDLETLGFFKVDVLGLGMLTAIRKTLELVFNDGGLRRRNGFGPATPAGSKERMLCETLEEERFDPLEVIARVPSEDSDVYARISEADTVGVFQIESRAQMAMLPRLRPQCFYDLVIEVAIVRPGPIQGGMVHPYLRRRNGEEPTTVPHPDLWSILERTLGVPLFQEQVMQLSIVGAGYSGGEADQLRRDMAAWKKNGRLLRHRERLLNGFEKKGIEREFGEALFEQIKGFGDYGFPESHAASFALLVYMSAWEKTHFPAHFVCGLLNSQPMGFYSPSSLVRDAQKHGVEVRGVSILHSDYDCTLEEVGTQVTKIHSRYQVAARSLRLGFRLIKGLGQKTARRIESARLEEPFRTLDDVIHRAALKKDEIEALAEAGALEELMPGRRHALWAARAPRRTGLFVGTTSTEGSVPLPALKASEQLLFDYGRVGLSINDHPIRHFRSELNRGKVLTAKQLEDIPHQSQVIVAGMVLSRQRPATASGVVFVTLEDETGTMNLVIFAKVFERCRMVAKHATLMLAYGKVERQLTRPRPGEVGAPTAVIHVVVRELERLDVPGRDVRFASRDFH